MLDKVEKVDEQEQVDIPDPGGILAAKRGSPKKRRIGPLSKQPGRQEPYHQGRGGKNPTGMLTRWRKKGMAAEKEKGGISQKERKEDRLVMTEAEGLERDDENKKSAEEQCDVEIGEDERLEDREEDEGWDKEEEKDDNNNKDDMGEKNKENEDENVDMIQGEKESSIAEVGEWEQTQWEETQLEQEQLEQEQEQLEQGKEGTKEEKIAGRYQWSEQATDTYCEVLVYIIRAGGRSESRFKNSVWGEVCVQMKQRYSTEAGTLTPKQCKDKYDNVSFIYITIILNESK